MKNKNLIVVFLVSFDLTIRNKDTLNNEVKNGIVHYHNEQEIKVVSY